MLTVVVIYQLCDSGTIMPKKKGQGQPKDAGINGIQDVEALPPPPEIKDNIPPQKYKGDVSYFICTRPGRGPVLLSDSSQALLNGETGLPK